MDARHADRGLGRHLLRRAIAGAVVVPATAALAVVIAGSAATPIGTAVIESAAGDGTPPATTTTYPTWTSAGSATTGGARARTATTVSTTDIPSVALTAYQRAATVINATDGTCHLSWSVLAAIGRVESDHGQYAGSRLDANGFATPAIIGARLDGRRGTTRIVDTDAGQLDGDTRFDHAVGPMQFLPATWSVVGVDADRDGKRDPQDINDAALGSAVYLCAGAEDLSTTDGLRRAVFGYNHSHAYVAQVLAIATAYAAGESWQVTAVPVSTTTVHSVRVVDDTPHSDQQTTKHHGTRHHGVQTGTITPPPPAGGGTGPGPSDPGTTDPGTTDPGDGTATGPGTDPTDPSTTDPGTTDPGDGTATGPGTDPTDPGASAEVPAEVAQLCTDLGYVDDPKRTDDDFDQCAQVVIDNTAADGTLPTADAMVALLAAAGIPPAEPVDPTAATDQATQPTDSPE